MEKMFYDSFSKRLREKRIGVMTKLRVGIIIGIFISILCFYILGFILFVCDGPLESVFLCLSGMAFLIMLFLVTAIIYDRDNKLEFYGEQSGERLDCMRETLCEFFGADVFPRAFGFLIDLYENAVKKEKEFEKTIANTVLRLGTAVGSLFVVLINVENSLGWILATVFVIILFAWVLSAVFLLAWKTINETQRKYSYMIKELKYASVFFGQ